MIRSMTGFGHAVGVVGGAAASAELRSVNHRFFNPTLKLPAEFARWEADVRETMRRRLTRGHVTLVVRTDRDLAAAPSIDERRFGTYVDQLRALQARYQLGGHLDVATVLRMPDVFATADRAATGESGAELVSLVERAVDALDVARAEEGARLADYVGERLGVIEAALGRVAARAPERLTAQRDRLRQSVRELASGVAVDEQRVAQEIAILADRLDVGEELSRFRSHIAACRAALGAAEPVGKRLGFLVQEMLREANTTGSKANDAAIVQEVVGIKEELERIREQVENLE